MSDTLQTTYTTLDTLGKHRTGYRQLHNLLFRNTAMSDEWLHWYHGKIAPTQTATRTHAVFDKDLLVGIWSVEPKTMIHENGKRVPVGRCFAVGIHPDYRRHGLFVQLSKFAIEQERKLGEYEYILGFPQQGRPVIGGHLKAGWELVENIDVYYFNPEHLEGFTPRSQMQWLTDFSQISSRDDLLGSFQNNAAYRNLKWLKHPDNQYLSYSLNQSYVVLKPYDNLCHILDLQGDEKDLVTLLKASTSLARRHRWREINIWCSEKEVYRSAIEKAGFRRGSELSPSISLLAVRINANTPLQFQSKCHFQMGVEEIY